MIDLTSLPLQDAAPRTNMLTPLVVAVGKRDRDTPSQGDYMERKLKAWAVESLTTFHSSSTISASPLSLCIYCWRGWGGKTTTLLASISFALNGLTSTVNMSVFYRRLRLEAQRGLRKRRLIRQCLMTLRLVWTRLLQEALTSKNERRCPS